MKPSRKTYRKRFWKNYERMKTWSGFMSCHYCNVVVSRDLPGNHPCKATIDHVTPLSKGGKNDLGNMVLCCNRCNAERNYESQINDQYHANLSRSATTSAE